jgi:hypothetical protein
MGHLLVTAGGTAQTAFGGSADVQEAQMQEA